MSLDDRMFAYLLEQRFSGDLQKGKQFCEQIFSYDVNVERIFGCAKTDERAVLDCVMKMFSNTLATKKKKLIKKINDHLLLLEKNPILSKELDNSRYIKDEIEDATFQHNEKRVNIFKKICDSACDEWRVIAHFLLDYRKIRIICIDNPDDVRERLRTTLEEWYICTPSHQATWTHLKLLLTFLNKQQLVSEIVDEAFCSSLNSNLCHIFRHMYHSAEKEKLTQYSATDTTTVPNEWSIIHSFIECMKEKNKSFNKDKVLEEISKEISDHLSWYEELIVVDDLPKEIEQYKQTGYHSNDQINLLLTALANAFKFCIKILTKDDGTSNLYRLKDETDLIYPSRVQISKGGIAMYLNEDGNVQPLQHVKVVNLSNNKEESIEVFCLKNHYCIFEVPLAHAGHCDAVFFEIITKKPDGAECRTREKIDLKKVDTDRYDGYDYILLKDLDKSKTYRCILEYQGEDGINYKLTSKEVSVKNERPVESHKYLKGYTTVAHKNIEDIRNTESTSMKFRHHFFCFRSANVTEGMSATDWTIQCEKYLQCNLIKNNKECFDEWIIFPNIFMDTTQNVTKDVTECIRDALSMIQDESTDPAGGVIFMYYDSQEHKKFLLKENLDEKDRDFSNRVLIFHQEMGAVLNIRVTESTRPKDISNEFAKSSNDADDLATAMDFLTNQGKITSPKITIATFVAAPNIHSNALKATIFKEKQTLICDGCIPRIITKDKLNEIGNMKKWLQDELPGIINNKSENLSSQQAILKQVIAQISGFMANTSIQVAYHSDDLHDQLIQLQANDEQIQVVVDPRKHKVIKAAFGCGKTVVATLQAEFLARIAKEPTTIFYISFDPFSLIDFYNDRHLKNLKLQNVESGLVNFRITNVSEMAVEMGLKAIPRVSQILGFIQEQQKKTGRICHVFIDELNTSTMSEREVQSINEKLSSMKDNFITLVLQAFQQEQFDIEYFIFFEIKTRVSKTYEAHLNMAYLKLRKNMRNSVKISELLEIAKDVINCEETRYYYPIMTFVEREPQIGRASISCRHVDGNETSDRCDTLTEDPGVTKTSKKLPVPMKNQEHILKQLNTFKVERSSAGILLKHHFERTAEVGHSHQGKIPEIMYIPSLKDIWKFDIGEKQWNVLKMAICLQNVRSGDTIICHDEEEFFLIRHALHVAKKKFITYAHYLENENKIPSIEEKQEVAEAIDGKKKIVLADSNGCRGLQIRKAVIPLSSTEQFQRQTILENAARATANILFIVIDCSALPWLFGSKKSTFGRVIERWDSQKMIMVNIPKVSDFVIQKFVKRLPATTVLQRTVGRKSIVRKQTFEDIQTIIERDKVSILKHILTADPSILKMKSPANKKTLLMEAAYLNRPLVLRLLLECGAEIEEKAVFGDTAFHFSIRGNSLECLHLLLSRAPHLINEENNFNSTALHFASRFGMIKAVELLLDHHADTHVVDDDGENAYGMACRWGGDDETKRRIQEVILQHEKKHPQ